MGERVPVAHRLSVKLSVDARPVGVQLAKKASDNLEGRTIPSTVVADYRREPRFRHLHEDQVCPVYQERSRPGFVSRVAHGRSRLYWAV